MRAAVWAHQSRPVYYKPEPAIQTENQAREYVHKRVIARCYCEVVKL